MALKTQGDILLTRFIIKGYMSEIARGRDIQGKVYEKGIKVPSWSECAILLESPSVHQPGSSPNPILLGFYEASFHRHV